MDSKITLSFDAQVILKAKEYAAEQGISLSRLTEVLLRRLTSEKGYTNLEDFPVSDWVNMLAEGPSEYVTKSRSRKELKKGFYEKGK